MSELPFCHAGHITAVDEVNYAVILIHGGDYHHPSKLALDIWRKYDIDCMRDIEVVDNRVKQWLLHNDFNLHITEIPCIVFCKAGSQPIVYAIQHIQKIIQSICKSRK
jgi:hypothetical protein